MKKTELLKTRLSEIAKSLESSGNALALLALGSCGRTQELMDEYSDLDFFVIVKPGYKMQYIDDLSWLESIAPAGFYFRNTVDGYKFLYKDSVYCEFGVFEESELKNIELPDGSIVWKDGSFAESKIQFRLPQPGQKPEPDWMLDELLTNLFVGLCRFRRGEKLSAYKFVQNYAVDQLLQLLETQKPKASVRTDRFDPARRMEARDIISTDLLSEFIQGYDKTPQSALAILRFVEEHFAINPFIKQQILALT